MDLHKISFNLSIKELKNYGETKKFINLLTNEEWLKAMDEKVKI